jgi:flagellar biosynthetic protein FliQ
MRVVVPAYVLSELKTGFQIGVALFLPFLVIDLMVAAVTTSIGMMQLPPGDHFDAPENTAVRHGGWVESAGGVADEKFCLRRNLPMGSDQVVALLRHTIETALWMGGPLLIAAVVVGLLINVVQVLTSLQDMTVSTVPRLAAVVAAVLLLMPWMARRIAMFTLQLFSDFHPFVR